jgi:hypothetical protein
VGRDRWRGAAHRCLAGQSPGRHYSPERYDLATQVIDWVRFPLQVPLIWFALQSGTQPSSNAKSALEEDV